MCKGRHVALFALREEQGLLENKLAAIQRKIIVGGENLMEKAEEQDRMLEESARELSERKEKEDQLRKQLEDKEVSRKHYPYLMDR